MRWLGTQITAITIYLGLIFLWAWTILVAWRWFAVEYLGAPALSYPQAVAAYAVLILLRRTPMPYIEREAQREILGETRYAVGALKVVGFEVFGPFFILSLLWVVRLIVGVLS